MMIYNFFNKLIKKDKINYKKDIFKLYINIFINSMILFINIII